MKFPTLDRFWTATVNEKAKVKGLFKKSLTMKLSEDWGIENTKKLYRQKTQPITMGGRFAAGNKDDSYYASWITESQETEQEVFYNEGVEEREVVDETHQRRCPCSSNDNHKSKTKQAETVVKRSTKFDREKLDKILVGVYLTWDDDKFDTLIPKLQLLVKVKADINTTWGSGLFTTSLLQRSFYGKHEKLRHALINMADSKSLEPRAEKSLLSLACEMCNYNTIKILLEKNCEPNRIEKNGTTPLIKLCRHSTHKDDDTDYVEQLKCIELLLSYEGPDARTLKAKWIRKWEKNCPKSIGSIGNAWYEVADFCIPNINVRPADAEGKTAISHLMHYKNSALFTSSVKRLLDHLYDDARFNKEKYWPRERIEYKNLFKSNWE